ncbi:MAG: NAD(P)-dependent glycerol-3-phosphate dehydrogenase [Myxococcales bacterium]|nr:NAD(P)-dependent glycerol-3-phosphate dehydrogenase [Myxococcales bacterium]
MKPSVSVIGGGSWGSTIAHLIGLCGHEVLLWCRSAEKADEINVQRTNAKYLGELQLSPHIRATTDLSEAVKGVPVVFVVVPSKAFRETARAIGDLCSPDQYLVHATKGLEPKSHKRMSEILLQETCVRQIGVLSGPNIAPELCAGKPAGTVIASRYPRLATKVQELLASEIMRVYANDDVLGVELGGTLKNIVAIGAGMAAQMELGENAKALLITRGLSEISRVGVALGANPMTFAGLAGIGDLIVTCSSPFSRNHRVGRRLAQGDKLEAIIETLGMVAEGVTATRVAWEIARELRLETPLLDGIFRVLYEGMHPQTALVELMRVASQQDIDQLLAR